MGSHACRSCSGQSGQLVLDLGNQPACDHFPPLHGKDSDPTYPLQMWLCSTCGLAQLVGEPIAAEEPLGSEPEALVAQAVDAVERLAGNRVALRSEPAWSSLPVPTEARGWDRWSIGAWRLSPTRARRPGH